MLCVLGDTRDHRPVGERIVASRQPETQHVAQHSAVQIYKATGGADDEKPLGHWYV